VLRNRLKCVRERVAVERESCSPDRARLAAGEELLREGGAVVVERVGGIAYQSQQLGISPLLLGVVKRSSELGEARARSVAAAAADSGQAAALLEENAAAAGKQSKEQLASEQQEITPILRRLGSNT
jgi:hypothetical protein